MVYLHLSLENQEKLNFSPKQTRLNHAQVKHQEYHQFLRIDQEIDKVKVNLRPNQVVKLIHYLPKRQLVNPISPQFKNV
jgi:hypothetical protein